MLTLIDNIDIISLKQQQWPFFTIFPEVVPLTNHYLYS